MVYWCNGRVWVPGKTTQPSAACFAWILNDMKGGCFERWKYG